jgi:hypothetical protein
MVTAISKNNSVLRQGINFIANGSACATQVTAIDVANGTDFYQVWIFCQYSAGNTSVDGGPVNTWFNGYWLGS